MFKLPRGTRDFSPEEMQKRRFVEGSMKETFESFGYKEVQTPVFETLELFTAKSGEGIIDELYSFIDKGGRNLALRPELTAPVIRMYIDNFQMDPKPIKMFYFGNCYRYDRPQKGRYREFKQAGCELIGTNTTEAYAELIALSYTILKNVGLQDIKLKIGNLNILNSIFEKLDIPKDKTSYLTPLIDKEDFEGVLEALNDFDINPKKATEFLEVLQSSDNKKILDLIKEDKSAVKEYNNLEKIIALLKKSYKIENLELKISIVRGLDYYKGIVFEIEAPKLGAEKQICGGGAYDLINLFEGRDSPQAGFAIGFDRTILALETEKFEFPKMKLDVFIIPINEELIEESIDIAHKLRKNKKTVDIDLLRRGIGKALKYASSMNARYTIIIGPDELEKKSVTVRNMETGNQDLVQITKINEFFKNEK